MKVKMYYDAYEVDVDTLEVIRIKQSKGTYKGRTIYWYSGNGMNWQIRLSYNNKVIQYTTKQMKKAINRKLSRSVFTE